jgi:hypothetical protein
MLNIIITTYFILGKVQEKILYTLEHVIKLIQLDVYYNILNFFR